MSCICQQEEADRWKVAAFTEEERARITQAALAQESDSVGRLDSVAPKTVQMAVHRAAQGMAGELAFSMFFALDWDPKLRQFNGADPDFPASPTQGPHGIEVRTAETPTLKVTDRDVENCRDRTFWAMYRIEEGERWVYYVLGYVHPWEVEKYPQVDPGELGKPYRRITHDHMHRLPYHGPEKEEVSHLSD